MDSKTCRKCGEYAGYAIDSRVTTNGRRRRYRCAACGERWSTLEVDADEYVAVKDYMKTYPECLDTGMMMDKLARIRAIVNEEVHQ